MVIVTSESMWEMKIFVWFDMWFCSFGHLASFCYVILIIETFLWELGGNEPCSTKAGMEANFAGNSLYDWTLYSLENAAKAE